MCVCVCVCGHLLNLGSLRTLLGYVVRKFIFSDLDSGSALNCSSNSPMMDTHNRVGRKGEEGREIGRERKRETVSKLESWRFMYAHVCT